MEKSVQAAVVILPPQDKWDKIQEIREKNDKAFQRWPPHINLLFPFVQKEYFDLAHRSISFKKLEPFKVILDTFDHFKQGSKSVLFLQPRTEPPNQINYVQAVLQKKFPNCDDVAKKSPSGYHPHLTIGQFPSKDIENIKEEYSKQWIPIEFMVDSIHFLYREKDTPFSIEQTVSFDSSKDQSLKTNEPLAIYQTDGKKGLVRVRIPYQSEGSYAHQILVIDSSGSMSGNPWKQVVESLKYIQSLKFNPDVVLYHSKASHVTLEYAITSRESGMTDFGAAFDVLEKVVMKTPEKNINVIFMTDGHDNCTKDMKQRLKTLQFFLKNCQKSTTIHTIGFGSSVDTKLLEELKELGTKPGMFRFGNKTGLDDRFNELFEYGETTMPVLYSIDGKEQKSIQAEIYESYVEAYIWFNDPPKSVETISVCIKDNVETLAIQTKPVDIFFELSSLKIKQYDRAKDVEEAQKMLNEMKIFRISKEDRIMAFQLRSEVQEILDKYHEILAGIAKSTTKEAALSSLRYEANFTKSRRQRLMNMRASKNSKETLLVKEKLSKLTIDMSDFENIELDTFTCDLMGEDILTIMQEDPADILGFGLNISRPEHGIEAPTQTVINEIGNTFVSQKSITEAIKYKIRVNGHESTHGGFNPSATSEAFQGRAREPINAFLPLYINESHWKRVECQLKNILGYFFTLDPLGYDDAQLLGLFMTLGRMIAMSDGSQRSKLIISEFCTVCQKMLPVATKYLGYDLMNHFIKSPEGRRKGVIHNLMTVVGWAYAKNADMEKLKFPLMEETYRRLFTNLFHGKPRLLVNEHLEILLYSRETEKKSIDENVLISKAIDLETRNNNKVYNKESIDRKFEEWAQFNVGLRKKNKKVQEPSEDILPKTQVTGRQIAEFDEIIEEKMKSLLSSIDYTYMRSVFEKIGLTWDIDKKLQREILINALRFSSNTLATQGINSGNYVNAWENPRFAMKSLHDEMEKRFKEEQLSQVENEKWLLIAKKAVVSKDIWAFCGRLMKYSPTRGGKVFDSIISLLTDPLFDVPLRLEKVLILFSGNIKHGENEYPIISKGMAWKPESFILEQLKNVLGEDHFSKFLISMNGRVCNHVYRLSDIPNRHGYCNSHPNPFLVQCWNM